jgi:hypothetical protein
MKAPMKGVRAARKQALHMTGRLPPPPVFGYAWRMDMLVRWEKIACRVQKWGRKLYLIEPARTRYKGWE